MKVLNALLDNGIGGPQIRVLSVAKELRKYGIDIIMLFFKGGDSTQRARNENFKAYQITEKRDETPQILSLFDVFLLMSMNRIYVIQRRRIPWENI